MTSAALFVSMLSIAVSCMALGLAIASMVFTKAKWNRWFIVFQACLVFTMVSGFMLTLSSADPVFVTVLRWLQHVTIGVALVLLPLISGFIVGKPWSRRRRLFFYPIALVYALSGLTPYERIIQTTTFVAVLMFCIGLLWHNLGKIEDRRTRTFILTLNIVVVSLVPTTIMLFLRPGSEQIGFPVYVLAFSALLLVYFFNRFIAMSREGEEKQTDLSQYKVTERETEVIECICNGMTNKEIAKKLNISVNTVNNHVANIFEKMNINSRVDLLRKVKGGLWS